jgi:hypothetical protein
MGYSRGQPNSSCNGYIHSDSHCYNYCDSNVHTYANRYRYGHGYLHAYAKASTNTEGSPDAATAPVVSLRTVL